MAGYSVTYSVVDNATRQIDAINKRITAMRAPMERMSRSVSRFVDVSGLRKVAQGFEWIGKTAAGVFRTLSQIVPVMGAITGAASIAGMVKLVNSYADWSHQLVQNADDIGITTQQLQQFQDATRLAGGNASDMTSSLQALHTNLAEFAVGRGNFAEIGQMAGSLGVNLRDANGQIRNAADLMPELIAKIAALPDPMNRSRAATALLGAEGNKLVETFRQSHQGFLAAFADAGRYTELTDEQKRSLQLFTEAQGRAGVAFDHLGQQISVVLARDFAPLLNRLSEFVEKHTPDIIKAIDDLSQRFAAWLGGIKWDDVEAGVNKFIESLKWVITHLDTILKAAGAIVTLFAVGWGVGIIANIAAVVAALAPLSAALAPILAGLALIATPAVDAAIKGVEESEAKKQGFEKRGGSLWNPFDKIPHWVNPKTGEDIPEEEMRRRLGADPNTGFSPTHLPDANAKPSTAPGAPAGGWLERGLGWLFNRAKNGPPEIQQQGGVSGLAATPFGALISRGEGTYNSVNRGAAGGYAAGTEDLENKTVAQVMADQAAQKYNAAGRYQIIGSTLKTAVASMGLKGDEKFDRAMQDRIFGEYLAGEKRPAIRDYVSGKSNDLAAAQLAAAQEWASVADPSTGKSYYPGNNRASISAAEMAEALQKTRAQIAARTPTPPTQVAQLPVPPVPPAAGAPAPQAPPVTVPPPTPVNGSVNVDITHKNAPPNSSVTATGSGSVNVAPVRVEHQDMASI
jgi:muramidase (phage lysozyme)